MGLVGPILLRVIQSKTSGSVLGTAGGMAHRRGTPVNEKDITSQSEVEIPRHLLPALRAAAVLGVELACDGEWDDGRLDRVEDAVHMRDALAAGSCTREQVSVLA